MAPFCRDATRERSPLMTDRADLVVVGGGIVGLATAYRLLDLRPGLRLLVLEKEDVLATHQTGRNSGVIHSPNTYAPGSLKARLCAEGMRDALGFADEHGIPYEICGELIVATEEAELPRLAAIAERARANGVTPRELGPEAMREVEPEVRGLRALHVPRHRHHRLGPVRAWPSRMRSAIAGRRHPHRRRGHRDPPDVGRAGPRDDGWPVRDSRSRHLRRPPRRPPRGHDRPRGGIRIVPFRGDYAILRPEADGLCRTLIYPVAGSTLPVPGRPPHAKDRRRGLGRPERRARLRPGGLPPPRR